MNVKAEINVDQEVDLESITDWVEEGMYDAIVEYVRDYFETGWDWNCTSVIINQKDTQALQNAIIKELYLRLDKNNK